jgi:hypothetical protein
MIDKEYLIHRLIHDYGRGSDMTQSIGPVISVGMVSKKVKKRDFINRFLFAVRLVPVYFINDVYQMPILPKRICPYIIMP